MPDPTLPPVGSLWLHRESGERRFVMRAEVSELSGRPLPIAIAVLRRNGEDHITIIPFTDWLSWQANAERIDKEQA